MNELTAVADTICRTTELGVTISGAGIDAADRTHLFCDPLAPDDRCPDCGEPGVFRDRVDRELVDVPTFAYPTRLHVRVPRYRCVNPGCAREVYRARIDSIAAPRSQVTTRTTRWILQRLIGDKMSVAAVARALGLSWDTVNTIAAEAARRLAYDGSRLDTVRVIGLDEHKWKHVRGHGDSGWVTVIVDLTALVDGTGPARLLDMVPGRSKKVLADWLADRDDTFRHRVKTVALDGFAGYRTAAHQELPGARTVMDPFHVVHLAAAKLTTCRQRIQQATTGRRGHKDDPLYKIGRILLTRAHLLTEKQQVRLQAGLSAHDSHVAVEVTWQLYQKLIAAYANKNRRQGKIAMYKIVKSIRAGVPKELPELAQLGRSLWSLRAQILAYFDTGVSNGPVEAINGRLEHLRGIALGFRNLNHYILRSLMHSGQLEIPTHAL
ncbi:putative transposase [Gordonia hirsuta DSM 44140 = NBRC 16056]|uniref:Putative transposase n=1 Tax=Gordonia hirsuta DSM 44140 = NBRC 16056 TaxID=1121927 RepID=L7LEL2_9ACTN|nr:ISL3 family transposase [Gordonia hirsuta]GAC58502.1 putative transposase [Gordonia hirsuta DSM 44140 = NBRC 16056]